MRRADTRDNPSYYEQYNWKESNLNEHLKGKVEKIFKMIPPDVYSIIDIGCGDGKITNRLAENFDVTGVDRSEKALAYVKTKKILSSSDSINVPDGSFDMVFSSELLEHIGETIFQKSIQEMKRISKKYIFITVPNDETIEKGYVKCPECGFIFNRSYHLRNLNLKKIKKLFPEYRVLKSFTYGTGNRGYHPFLLKIKHKLVPSSAWIPNYWTPGISRITICPRCQKNFMYLYRFNILGSLCDLINMLVSPHKPYWLFVLLRSKVNK